MRKVMSLYILLCSDDTLYTGVSSNLENRIIQHQTGFFKTCYTFSRRPVKLLFHEQFDDFLLAFDWEDRIKRWSRAKKYALIAGDFELLKKLSKKMR
jgi:putative endonuclease